MGLIILIMLCVIFIWSCIIANLLTFIKESKIHGVHFGIAFREFRTTMIVLFSFGLLHLFFWTFMLIFGELTIK